MTEAGAADPVIVVGLGNPILGDDGVGWRVIDALDPRVTGGGVELDRLAVGGVALMERLLGHRRAVLVDAILDGGVPGTVWTRPLAAVVTREASHLDSSHDAPLPAALAAARALGGRVPDQVTVVGIVIERADRFGEALSAPVAAAVEPAVRSVLAVLAAMPGTVPAGDPAPGAR